jgi:hypothetical protein
MGSILAFLIDYTSVPKYLDGSLTYTDIFPFPFFFGIVTPLPFRPPHLHLIRFLISFVNFPSSYIHSLFLSFVA